MPMDFSLGLMLYDSMLLIRYNGFHGTTKAGFYNATHHAHVHAHILTIEDIENSREKDPSHIVDLTGEYLDIRTAKVVFFQKCGILDYEKYFDLQTINEQLRFETE